MTAFFLPPTYPKVIIIDKRDDGRPVFQLAEPFGFHSDVLGRDVIAPAGFVTDLESIPRMLDGFTGRCSPRAGIIHDWLYQSHEHGVTKAQADLVLREAELADGVDAISAEQKYAAVDFYGQGAWASGPHRLQVVT